MMGANESGSMFAQADAHLLRGVFCVSIVFAINGLVSFGLGSVSSVGPVVGVGMVVMLGVAVVLNYFAFKHLVLAVIATYKGV